MLHQKRETIKKGAIYTVERMDTIECEYKCDLIFKTYGYQHMVFIEVGVTEAVASIVHLFLTKSIEESYIKHSLILKDMLDNLLNEFIHYHRSTVLRVAGFFHTGLSSVLHQLARPVHDANRSNEKQTIQCWYQYQSF